ncbi:HAMP domain-containing histidine kinase [Fusibacter paucivorans]|uniref:histidine kinase n=1 Tax=Fusibacter paucivorans TaxID=76009 RepID=A0ABS5PQY5_9FIRM|nr:HAMP domain-containing sensor histidine kinase [Fusibacter paucivorans]MBS7527337.1 HAMP domain-containing histidine kinase [Fusibacter paucivorans]
MKTIFHKFAFIYIMIFLISFIFIIIGVRSVLEYYFINNESELIEKRAANFEKVVNEQYFNTISLDLLQDQILILDGYTGANIWLISETGELYKTSNDLDADSISSMPNLMEDIVTVFSGDTTRREVIYEGVYEDRILRVGYPFHLGNSIYAMFINVPMPEIEDTISKVSVIIFFSLALSGCLAVVLIFLITQRMGYEIKVINDAAKYISEGNFDKKIIINRKDELGELANSFNLMADELNQQENTKRMFISSLSHDLRTPLTTIKGYTIGILDGTIEADKQERYLNIVKNESERLIKMINDLLDLSKMESGALILNKTDFDLSNVILNVLDSFEQKIIKKRIKLTIEFSKEKVLAHGDLASIQRVVYNLLDNATKFVEEDGAISIRTELKNDKYYVGISNTGRVLDEKELSVIWDRFSKLDKSRGLEKTSSGLGLSIVREIIKAHHETIEVYSNQDIGVAFIFTVSTQIFKSL